MEEMNESSSSSSDFIRDRLEVTRSITSSAYENNTVLECLQNKINELLRYKEETYSLKAKLQIAQESLKMQEAEFAFQREDLNNEIDHLKSMQSVLHERINKYEKEKIKTTYTYDVQVSLENEKQKCKLYEKKTGKWKGKAKSLEDQLQIANQNILKLNRELENAKKVDIKKIDLHKVDSQDNEYDNQAHKMIINNNSKQKQEISKYKKHIQKQNMKIQELEKDKEALKAHIQELETNLEETEKNSKKYKKYTQQIQIEPENQLREENKRILARNKVLQDRIRETEATISSLKDLIHHIDLERDSIIDQLEIEADDINGSWSKMNEKIRNLISKDQQIKDLQIQNSKLKKRLSVALEESKNVTPKIITKDPEEDELIRSLRDTLHQTRKELELANKQIDKMRTRSMFAAQIDRASSNLCNQITELHDTIMNKQSTQIRSVFLAVIFAKRFLRFSKASPSFDSNSLSIFNTRPESAISAKLLDLRGMLTSLTQDLLNVKQNYIDSINERKEIQQKYAQFEEEHQKLISESKLNKKKLKYLMNRIQELQIELSTLVSPDQYQDVCKRAENLVIISQKREEEKNQLEIEVEKRTELAQEMKKAIDEMTVLTEEKQKRYKSMKSRQFELEEEIRSLQSLLREKTKEILSLERLVSVHQNQNETRKSSLACLSVENRNLQNQLDASAKMCGMNDNHHGLQINPAFLGQ